jgi:hypothetical protein
MHMSTLLATLVNRGDAVSIEQGRLAISPPSGESLPAHWLQAHTPILLREILAALSIEAYEYISYTTGFYGRIKAPGVTLKLAATVTGINAYTLFNADLSRDRTTKAEAKGTRSLKDTSAQASAATCAASGTQPDCPCPNACRHSTTTWATCSRQTKPKARRTVACRDVQRRMQQPTVNRQSVHAITR